MVRTTARRWLGIKINERDPATRRAEAAQAEREFNRADTLFDLTVNEAKPQTDPFRETTGQGLKARLAFSPRAREQKSPPSNTTRGNELPVLGSCAGSNVVLAERGENV